MNAIVRRVCKRHGFLPSEVWGGSRDARFWNCRVEIARDLRVEGWSLVKISVLFGRRHNTISRWIKGGK